MGHYDRQGNRHDREEPDRQTPSRSGDPQRVPLGGDRGQRSAGARLGGSAVGSWTARCPHGVWSWVGPRHTGRSRCVRRGLRQCARAGPRERHGRCRLRAVTCDVDTGPVPEHRSLGPSSHLLLNRPESRQQSRTATSRPGNCRVVHQHRRSRVCDRGHPGVRGSSRLAGMTAQQVPAASALSPIRGMRQSLVTRPTKSHPRQSHRRGVAARTGLPMDYGRLRYREGPRTRWFEVGEVGSV